ncbi:MAG: phosphatidylserine decarboxylase [Acidobacteria bacterium]|nr:phosphatidylserine decarboxylase [Acidobacteriota bacterium]
MVRDGYFYGGGLLLVAFLLWRVTGSHVLAAIPVILACFFLWFFRDPNRSIPAGPGQIVSPGDGKVTEADWIETPQGSRLKLSIFLNVFDVHVNRAPEKGVVKQVVYRRGLFLNAMRPDSAALNEQNMIVFDCGSFEIAIKQIAGLLARRIVCTVKEGDRVERGSRVGLIKFGSRVDVLLPADVDLLVKKGDRVKGGSTVLAVLSESSLNSTVAS